MSREVTEAHYLHERSGLEAVLRPPVKFPTALAWVPKKEELLVTTREGELVRVDPVLGTRVLASDLGESAVLSVNEDKKRYLVMNRQGRFRVATMGGEVLLDEKHAYLGQMQGFWAKDYVVMVGDEADGRFLQIWAGTQRKARVKIPKRVTGTMSDSRKLLLCRSTEAGLEVVPFGKKARFQADLNTTAHRLHPTRSWVLGFTATGVALWGQEGGQPRSMRLPDLTAGDISKDGVYLGLGTKFGAVALARIDKLEKRIRPDLVRAFESPITSAKFSDRGRWLATGAEGLRIWSWED